MALISIVPLIVLVSQMHPLHQRVLENASQDQVPAPKQQPDCESDRVIIDQLQITNSLRYSKNKVPIPGMTVWIRVEVLQISAVSALTQDFSVDLFIHELWEDPLLQFNDLNPCKLNISLDHELYKHLWTPNTCFINSKHAEIHESPFKNLFLMIYPDGFVWAYYRVQLTGPCAFHLENFPWDYQLCYLTFESFNYNVEEMKMRWMETEAVSVRKEKRWLPDFYLYNMLPKQIEANYAAGKWDEMTLVFYFKRRAGWYLLQAYIPSYLTIFVSWISFCLGTKAIPPRTMIGLNSLLALTYQFGNILRNLPRVSYIKAIDVWMLTSISFVFLSLIELAVIGWLSHRIETYEERRRHREKLLRRRTVLSFGAPSTTTSFMTPAPTNKPNSERDTEPEGVLNYDRDEITIDRRDADRHESLLPSAEVKSKPENRLQEASRFQCQSPKPGCFQRLTCRSKKRSDLRSRNGDAAVSPLGKPPWSPEKIDRIASIGFPMSFLLFNTFYWAYYLTRPKFSHPEPF